MSKIPKKKAIEIEKNEIGCHLVISHKPHQSGYIEKWIDGKRYKLHRFIYEQIHGKIPNDLVIRHKCDNPTCINPDHLEIGTHEDNVEDRVVRNRSAIGISNGRAKLTDEDVRFIRSNKVNTNRELSIMFNVDSKVIRDVKSFKTWRHVL